MFKKLLTIIFILANSGILVACSQSTDTIDYHLPILKEIATIALGHDVSMLIMEDRTLWAWGRNELGQLGDGTTQNRYRPVKIMDDIIAVSSVWGRTMAVQADGTLWAWGDNSQGHFGNGTTLSSCRPVQVMDRVIFVSMGGIQTAVIRDDNSLWVWGSLNQHYSVDEIYPRTPQKIMNDILYVSAGASGHTMIICAEGALWAFGINHSGELGIGIGYYSGSPEARALPPVRLKENVLQVSTGGEYTAAITNDGNLWAWGYNLWGNLGDGTRINRHSPVMIMNDVHHVSLNTAIKNDGTLWTWGFNMLGALGDGTYINRQYPVQIMENVSMAASFGHTIAQTYDGLLWAWGSNIAGQLGIPDITYSNIPLPIAFWE